MPLAAHVFLAYAAGLLVGFGGFVVHALVATAIASVALAWCRRWHHAVLLLVALCGAYVAGDVGRRDTQCADGVRRSQHAVVQLATPLARGRSARGVLAQDGCGAAVRIRAHGAQLPAGSLVDVRGTVARRGGTLDIDAARVRSMRAPGRLDRWRGRVAREIDALFAEDAPLARALVLADATDLDRALRDRFADAGIVHMLSVSGLHVAIIASALRAGLSAIGATVAVADAVSLIAATAFVAFIGAPPPAVRSIVMLVLVALTRRAQRPSSVWAIWATSCAASLLEARVVLDLGWQLSVTGMAGLLASGPLVTRWCRRLRGLTRTVAEGVIATSVASLATAPLVAWTFGRVSLAALVTNPAAAPLFGIAQPLLFASVLAAPIPVVARFLADATRGVLWAIDAVARVGASLPLAVLSVQPDLASTVLLAVAATALLVAAAGRWPRRPLLVALGALALAAWWPTLAPGPGRLELHVLDVGQGDALALRTPKGRWILVDAGGGWRGGDAAQGVIIPYLRRYGGDVALLATTHPHADHIGGAARLVRFGARVVWDGGYVSTSPMYRDLLETLRQRATPWRRARAGDSTAIDGVTLRVLAPDSAWLSGLDDPNEASLVLHVRYGDASFLLTGDAETGEEEWLVREYGRLLAADVLKVGHHGSRTSTSPAFLADVQPRLALVSVGAGNTYGHPSPEVVRRIEAQGAQLLRTDDEGTIVVSTDGRTIEVRANGGRWTYSAGRSVPSTATR